MYSFYSVKWLCNFIYFKKTPNTKYHPYFKTASIQINKDTRIDMTFCETSVLEACELNACQQ